MHIKINGSEINYLIHGQNIHIEYEVPNAWFLIFTYRKGASGYRKIVLRGKKGIFSTQANCYDSKIKIWKFKWTTNLIKVISLNVNFINTCEQIIKTHYSGYKKTAPPSTRILNLNIKNAFIPKFSYGNIKSIDLICIKDYDDLILMQES